MFRKSINYYGIRPLFGQLPIIHMEYGQNLQLGSEWEGKLKFISTENSFYNGGLIEGALETAFGFVKYIKALNPSLIDNFKNSQFD